MPSLQRILCTILKIVPLGAYLRSVCCKFEVPILGCNEPLCPAAIGEPVIDGCFPTGNTAELKAWCEHGWTPWFNGLLESMGQPGLAVTCSESSGYQFMKILGMIEAVGYALLWFMPIFGAFFMTVFMGFGLHFHLTALKDPASKIILQLVLFSASFLIMYLEMQERETSEAAKVEAPKPVKKKPIKIQ